MTGFAGSAGVSSFLSGALSPAFSAGFASSGLLSPGFGSSCFASPLLASPDFASSGFVSAGFGVIYRSDMFAAIDNTVTLPGYTRADAAVYGQLTKQVRLQVNVENLFDKRYYVNADSNTNISPGFPRTVRVGLTATF